MVVCNPLLQADCEQPFFFTTHESPHLKQTLPDTHVHGLASPRWTESSFEVERNLKTILQAFSFYWSIHPKFLRVEHQSFRLCPMRVGSA